MKNPGIDARLWSRLDGKLWHATSPSGWRGIVRDSAVKVLNQRYKSAFSKRLVGVSLFDFGDTSRDYGQVDNWTGWFGHQQDGDLAIWLEVDRAAVSARLLDAGSMHRAWLSACDKPKFIPGVEACHKGDLPISAVVGALLIERDRGNLFRSVPIESIEAALLDLSSGAMTTS